MLENTLSNCALIEYMSNKEQTGSFIIQKQKHLQEFGDPDLRYYRSTLFAGQCGRFLGKIRGMEVIHDIDQIDIFAADLGIYKPLERNYMLETLEKNGCIEIYRKQDSIEKIEEGMNTENEILSITQEIWEKNPTDEEVCSLDAIRFCTKLPRLEPELIDYLMGVGHNQDITNRGIELTTKFKMNTRYENISGINHPVLHTPLYGSYNVQGIMNKISHLDYDLKTQLESLIDQVGTYQATPLDQITFPSNELDVLDDLGVSLTAKVETSYGASKKFVFTPSMWGPFGTDLMIDEQEHVRAMLSCVRYGQLYPTEINGRLYPIKMPVAYLGAFIRHGRVGPATPIGSDYVILEREGIVKLEKSKYKRNMYEMILIKEDVAQRSKRILERSYDDGFSAESKESKQYVNTGKFKNPVQTRLTDARLRQTTQRSTYLEEELLKKFRGEK